MAAMHKRKISDNAGISLMELLLVIAILSIAVGLAGIGISLVFSRDSERCAKTLEGALATARMNAMAQKGTFTLTVDTLGHIVKVTSSERGDIMEENLPRRVTVSFEVNGGTVDLSSAEELVIEFDKATGKVKAVSGDGTAADGTVYKIHCESENGKRAAAVLVAATGKHYVEYE